MDSLGSYSANKAVAPKVTTTDASDQESGWTSYFEDFLSKQREEALTSFSGRVVSDAAASVPCSQIDGSPVMPKKLRSMKARSKKIRHDDSLEDTASSPVNSPKVGSLKLMDANPIKRDDNIGSSLGRGSDSVFCSELQTDEGNEMILEEKSNECANLNKRGLSLAPLSMLANYFG